MDQNKQQFKAVLFDMGGVIVEYKNVDLYQDGVNKIASNPELYQRFQDFECGRISLMDVEEEFLRLFGINGTEDIEKNVFKLLGRKNQAVDQAVNSLRSSGKYTLGLLTNNGFVNLARSKSTLVVTDHQFDFVIESCKIGYRKPEAAFYEAALTTMGLQADECIFIDDLEHNCAGAEAVGIRSIWLKNGDGQAAMEQLEALLGEKLLLPSAPTTNTAANDDENQLNDAVN